MLERFERGHALGGSHGGSRIFRLAYDKLLYLQRARDALTLWRELEETTGITLLDATGGVDHGSPDAVDVRAGLLRDAGVPFDVLDAGVAAKRWEGMRFENRVLFQPDAGRLYADRAVATLQDQATRFGAELRFDERTLSVERTDGGVRVTTETGEYAAPVAVLAVGSWTRTFLPDVSLRVTQEQPAHFRAASDDLDWPSFIHHAPIGTYGLNEPGVGVKVGEHTTGDEVDPDDRDFEVHAGRMDRLCSFVAKWFPGLDPTPVATTTCLYDTSHEEEFILERRGPVVVGAGFSGHGFKFTPLIGRILADLATGLNER